VENIYYLQIYSKGTSLLFLQENKKIQTFISSLAVAGGFSAEVNHWFAVLSQSLVCRHCILGFPTCQSHN